jgi:propanol-preferring alcohol dehydrogenase
MKAMLLEDYGRVESAPLKLMDVADPEPDVGEVRIKVSACAVCRTDLHVIERELPPEKLPVIPGHQIVGIVDRVGPETSIFNVGDRIGVAWLRRTCGVCEFCISGRENLCESSRFTGYHADGGFAEYALVPEAYAYAIPEGYSDVRVSPMLCAGIIGFRALKRARVPKRGVLAMYGYGSSAHIIAQIAKARGYTVYVISRNPHHQALARTLGADWAGAAPEEMPHLPHSAISFTPVGETIPIALRHLRKGGTLAVAGIYVSQIPAMDYGRCLFYERDLRTVTANTREDGRELLEEAAAAGVAPETTEYPLEDANRALQDLKSGRLSGTAVLTM